MRTNRFYLILRFALKRRVVISRIVVKISMTIEANLPKYRGRGALTRQEEFMTQQID